MQLTKLVLKNFRSHKQLTLEFNSGVTGILGGNGTGKSSIVEAIIFLLTGDGYGRSKAEMLTVGESTGYVVGYLMIDGKEAVLERHIDATKVLFKYDGVTYKKSGEVAEIWSKLFQIDKTLVQSVIVSNQGEISMLFNGDPATKEKLFQKIFMVPNTTKLRDTVWNSYIKTAPPEYSVKDSVLLESNIQCIEKIVELTSEELSQFNLDEKENISLRMEKTRLEQIKAGEGARKANLAKLKEAQELRDNLQKRKAEQESLIASVDIGEYRKLVAKLDAAAPLKATADKYRAALDSLVAPIAVVGDVSDAAVEQLRTQVADLRGTCKSKHAKIKELEDKCNEYKQSGLSSGVCPTCGTELKDVVKLLAHIEQELQPLTEEYQVLVASGVQQAEKLKELEAVNKAHNHYKSEKEKYEALLAQYKDIDYNSDDHKTYRAVLAKAEEIEAQLKSWSQELVSLERLCADLERETKLDVDEVTLASLDSTISQINEKIQEYDQQSKIQSEKSVELRVKQSELEAAKKEHKENQENLEKNKKREEYVEILTEVYDVLHTSKFPRSLINTYASTVTEYMQEVLESFDFPYTAKVNETFGIDVFNSEGLQLPSISGGQQVMVGFSLRLALHNMFVGAFPFMIVDEGSYGLNAENSQKYFEIIAKLNKSSKFKQVIVIDHHPELSDYVDNVINL